MGKRTWNVFLVHRASKEDKYLGSVYEETIEEAEASALCSLSSHDESECYLKIVELR